VKTESTEKNYRAKLDPYLAKPATEAGIIWYPYYADYGTTNT